MKYLMRVSAVFCGVLMLKASAFALSEDEVRELLCADKVQEEHLRTGTFVDCYDDTHAIEIDFSDKWAQAIGQSLHYATVLDKKAGIYLVCRKEDEGKNCNNDGLRLEETIANNNLDIDVCYFFESKLEGPDAEAEAKSCELGANSN